MAVITLTITESANQVISGIPQSVIISANIPSSIFYTLDGTIPTLYSNIYAGPISLPINMLSITLNIFATNGVDSSPIITEVYTTNMLNDTRLPHSATDVAAGANIPGLYPFGTNPIQPTGQYLNPGDAGTNINDSSLPTQIVGYGSDGYANSFTNQPFNSTNYNIVYSTADSEGQVTPGVGNLPANIKVQPDISIPEESDQFSNMFDPRAFVIFQDFSKENSGDPVHINRQFFTLENPERARDGVSYYNTALDAPPVSGSFLRSHYNPRDNTMSYYYYDSWSNRWIISKTPYKPTGPFDGNLSKIVFGRDTGTNGVVFEWLNFTRRVLF
jgi:hypothetical protein